MIDLHMHSVYSDGTDTVEEILKKAEKLKLKYISITDHDNCNSYFEIERMDVKKYFSGRIVTGIEIKCAYGDKIIEVLGYKFDYNKMKKWTEEFYKDKSRERLQQKYFDELYNNCIKKGFILKEKSQIEFNPKVQWASVCIFNELKSNAENKVKAPQDFFGCFDTFSKKYCADKKFGLYIDKSKDYPRVDQAVKVIKECGGLAFAPHVYIYKWVDNMDKHIDTLINQYHLDGLECFHSEFSEENINHLLEVCNKKKILISGGSDYHGTNKKGIDMAVGKGNLSIDEKYVENWISSDKEHFMKKEEGIR